jgi:hypothetical protein
MSDRPYAKLAEILRFTLEQLEKDTAAYPDNAQMGELKRSLRRQLASLEGNSDDGGSQDE